MIYLSHFFADSHTCQSKTRPRAQDDDLSHLQHLADGRMAVVVPHPQTDPKKTPVSNLLTWSVLGWASADDRNDYNR